VVATVVFIVSVRVERRISESLEWSTAVLLCVNGWMDVWTALYPTGVSHGSRGRRRNGGGYHANVVATVVFIVSVGEETLRDRNSEK
jgi:hypothetical protein